MPAVLDRVLGTENADLLVAVFAQCEPRVLMMRIAPVCRSWAATAEVVLRELCAQRRWQLARRPRGGLSSLTPYRALWVQRACRGCCDAAGDYAVRDTPRGGTLFLLCRACCVSERVLSLLVHQQLCFDTLGLSGRPLQNESKGKGRKRRRMSYV